MKVSSVMGSVNRKNGNNWAGATGFGPTAGLWRGPGGRLKKIDRPAASKGLFVRDFFFPYLFFS
jgi:hypothetical protein